MMSKWFVLVLNCAEDRWWCFKWRSFKLRTSENLLVIFWRASPSDFFAQTGDVFWSLTRGSWHIWFQYGRRISPSWGSFSFWWGCRNSAFCRRFTLRRFFIGCKLHQRFIIFIFLFRNGSAIWTKKRGFVIFVVIQFLGTSWICWCSLRRSKSYMFRRRPDRSRDFGGTQGSSNPTQHVPLWIFDWRRVQAKSWTCNLGSFWIQFKCNTQILHLWKGE